MGREASTIAVPAMTRLRQFHMDRTIEYTRQMSACKLRGAEAQPAVEHRPAEVIAAPLIVEDELPRAHTLGGSAGS